MDQNLQSGACGVCAHARLLQLEIVIECALGALQDGWASWALLSVFELAGRSWHGPDE